MSDPIDISTFSAKRRATGSKVSYSFSQFDMTAEAFVYEDEARGLKVGFPALYIDEVFSLVRKAGGDVIQESLCVGVILVKGHLKAEVAKQLGVLSSSSKTNEAVSDVYELLVELLRNPPALKKFSLDSKLEIHIYEAESRRFWDVARAGPADRKFRAEVLSTLVATLVI
jgi:hypothetical protein